MVDEIQIVTNKLHGLCRGVVLIVTTSELINAYFQTKTENTVR